MVELVKGSMVGSVRGSMVGLVKSSMVGLLRGSMVGLVRGSEGDNDETYWQSSGQQSRCAGEGKHCV